MLHGASLVSDMSAVDSSTGPTTRCDARIPRDMSDLLRPRRHLTVQWKHEFVPPFT